MTTTNNPGGPTATSAWLTIFRTVKVCAGVFLAVVCILVLANFLRTRQTAPLDVPALAALRAQLRADPGNAELKSQIRALDLLARRAFFSSADAARAGAWLLLGGSVVWLIALWMTSVLQGRLPLPDKSPGPDEGWFWRNRTAQLVIGLAGGIVVAASLGLSLRVQRAVYPEAEPAPVEPTFAAREERLRNWPAFRGPDGDGVARVANAPTAWDGVKGEGIVWKTAVPLPGFSSPIVWSNRVFVTGADATNREVFCFAADTGQLAWRRRADNVPGSPAKAPETTEDTGLAAPTAATDGRRVFAIFGTGDLIALDLTGKRLWARNLGVPENSYGHASSLITYRNLLLVQYDHKASARLLALDAAAGTDVWTAPRTDISWGSPVCLNTGARDEVILTCYSGVDSYDPLTGGKRWGEKCLSTEVGTSVAFADGMVFAANAYSQATAIRIGSAPGEPPSAVAWTYDEDLPDVASPLAVGGCVFLANGGGIVTCLDAKNGAVNWQHDFCKGFYASPILVGRIVYALDRDGVMHLFAADKVFAPQGEAPLGEPSVCTPAFAGGRIYLRGSENLYCVGAK